MICFTKLLISGWCYTWGRRGGCQRYKAFMKDYCPKTCDLCSQLQITAPIVIQSKCEDKDVRCPSWAQYTNYKCLTTFLKETCPKSCRVCTAPSFLETPNHNYGAVIVEGSHGHHLVDKNGCDMPSFQFIQIIYVIIAQKMLTFISIDE